MPNGGVAPEWIDQKLRNWAVSSSKTIPVSRAADEEAVLCTGDGLDAQVRCLSEASAATKNALDVLSVGELRLALHFEDV
jgi:hypothetical protein